MKSEWTLKGHPKHISGSAISPTSPTKQNHVDGLPKKEWSGDDARLSARAWHRCEYCDLDFLSSVENYKQFQVDHVIPKSQGGSDNNDNLAVACWTCKFALKLA